MRLVGSFLAHLPRVRDAEVSLAFLSLTVHMAIDLYTGDGTRLFADPGPA